MRLSLYYPIRGHMVTQKWGVYNPIYEKFGFSRHNGTDINVYNGERIYCPLKGKVSKTGYQPEGAGYYICVISDETYDFPDGKYAVEAIFMHNKSFVAQVGHNVDVGFILAYGDNTGFSTGPHSHVSFKRVIKYDGGYRDADKNDATGTFDPDPYWNGIFAHTQTLSNIQKMLNWILEAVKGRSK